MKKTILLISGILLLLALVGSVAMYIWIDVDVKENIQVAKEKYGGKAEDALIAYLLDTTNSPSDRSHVAIWTLGQIHSEKAIPILTGLYENDPEGKTCKGKHDSVLCQKAINNALKACRSTGWPLHARLNK